MGKPMPLRRGECFFTFPWQEHGSAVPLDQGIDALWLVLLMDCKQGSWQFRHPAIRDVDLGDILHKSSIKIEQRPRLFSDSLFSYVGLLIKALGRENGPWLSKHLTPLLVSEWREFALRSPTRNGHSVSKRQAVSTPVRRAWRTICHQHDRPWTVADMAELAGVGRSQFSASIVALTGSSPIQSLNRERLAAACDDLLAGDDSVSLIAQRHGFQSQHYFARQFRQYTRQSPSEFREAGGQIARGWADDGINSSVHLYDDDVQ